jgi:hypothetical protein
MITLIGVLANADEWSQTAAFAVAKGEWLKNFLKLPDTLTRHDTTSNADDRRDGAVQPKHTISGGTDIRG